MTYSWSISEEGPFHGPFDTVEEAVADGRSEYAYEHRGETFTLYVGTDRPKPKAGQFVPDGWSLIDMLQTGCADNEQPEQSEDWLDEDKGSEASHDLRRRIQTAVNEWADEWGSQPTWWTVEDVERHVVQGEAVEDVAVVGGGETAQ